MIMKQPDPLFSSIVTYAVRYGLGRRTYAVTEITSFTRDNIRNLDDKSLGNIKRDILEAESRNNLGDLAIDAPEWLNLIQIIDDEMKRRADLIAAKKQAAENAEIKRRLRLEASERAADKRRERLEAIEACKVAAVGYIIAEANAGNRPKMTEFQKTVESVYGKNIAAAAWHDLERVRSKAIRKAITDGRANLKYGRVMWGDYRMTYDDIRAISIKSGIELKTLLAMGLDTIGQS